MIKVAMIGFGGIAQIHRYAYWDLARKGHPVSLVAACDKDLEKFSTVTKINLPLGEITDEKPFNKYTDVDEMINKEQPDMVDICLPTFLHKSTTINILNKGIPVLCEKPMALNHIECQEMLSVAQNNNINLMIGQCLRFYPEYEYLKKLIDDNIFGNVISSSFYRFSPPPFWSKVNWQKDLKKSGGCLTELNIHDVDYVRYAFGEPEEVKCLKESKVIDEDFVKTELIYSNHTSTIFGGWTSPGSEFKYGYDVDFEKAKVSMNNGKISICQNGKVKEVDILNYDGIIGEIKYYIDILENKKENTVNPPESSAKTILLLEELNKSAEQDGKKLHLGAKHESENLLICTTD